MMKAINWLCKQGYKVHIEQRDKQWVVTLSQKDIFKLDFTSDLDVGIALAEAYEFALGANSL